MLEVRNLSVTLRTPRGLVRAVRDVSFTLEQGETLALVGESGCGKSLLCRAIAGLLPASAETAGEIRLSGQAFLRPSGLRRDGVAMVQQDPMAALDPSRRVGEQIALAARVNQRLSRAQARGEAEGVLARLGLAGRGRQYPHQLSGGMRQRAAVALALACRPQVLVLDEVTTALDATTQQRLLHLLRAAAGQTSVILVTHDLGVAARASRVAVLYAGKVVELGTAREVFKDPRHPYTWGLMQALPACGRLGGIPGEPPSLTAPLQGDAFAPRNPYALQIDYEQEPPLFSLSPTHQAATWLCHPLAPRVPAPVRVRGGRIKQTEDQDAAGTEGCEQAV